MKQTIDICIIGDFDGNKPSHVATNEAIRHTADYLSLIIDITWTPTPSLLTQEGKRRLEQFDGIWASPGSPYESMEGAVNGIRIAREMNIPFTGT